MRESARRKSPKEPVRALNWDYNCRGYDPEECACSVQRAAECGLTRIQLRITNKGFVNYRSVYATSWKERLDAFGPDFDPLNIMAAECHRCGLEIFPWIDLFEGWYDAFLLAHPDFCPITSDGRSIHCIPCYAYAEVREYRLSWVRELADRDVDGIFFCTKSNHIPSGEIPPAVEPAETGFNLPIVQAYKERFGIDIRYEEFDREVWANLRGEFVEQFLGQARDILHTHDLTISLALPYERNCMISTPIHIDWHRLLENHIVDELSLDNHRRNYNLFYSEKGLEKMRKVISACQKGKTAFLGYMFCDRPWRNILEAYGPNILIRYAAAEASYFLSVGAQGMVFHDAELISKENSLTHRPLEVSLWRALGKAKPKEIPQFPQIILDEAPLGQNFVVVNKRNSKIDVNGTFEMDRDCDGEFLPLGWEPQIILGGPFRAIYDYRAKGGNESGRAHNGRSSILIVAEGSVLTKMVASWKYVGQLSLPPGETVKISVWLHAEGLCGFSFAGIEVRDTEEKKWQKIPGPTSGTFPWILVSDQFITQRGLFELRLSVHTCTGPVRGKIWFDDLTIRRSGGNGSCSS